MATGTPMRRLVAATALITLVGCSSPVRTGQRIDAGSGVGPLTPGGAVPTAGAPGGPARPGTPGAPGQPGTPGRRTRNTGPRPSAIAPVGSKPAPPIKFSQGITPTTIRIGAFLASYAGLEAKGLNLGDAQIQSEAVAAYLNDHGGIAGRKVVLSFAKLEASSTNWAADEQEICTKFAEQDKVFAVVFSLVGMGKTLLPCLAAHNVPLLAGVGAVADKKLMDQFANHYYYTGGLDLNRTAELYIDGLKAQGYFDGPGSVGLVRLDTEAFTRAANQTLKPRLAKYGIQIAAGAEALVEADTSVAKTASQMPNIVLKFQQLGIKKVLFLDNATMAVLFAIQAGSQNYYPTYGLTSLSAPAGLLQPNVPAEALAGARGVGWVPALDVDTVRDANNANPQTKVCTQIMVAAGQGGVSAAGHMQQRMFCDELFFLKRTLDNAREITPAGLRERAEALGTSYISALALGPTRFGPGRHDGAATVRYFAFEGGCKCFKYVAPAKMVG